jgi:hypothetical protein
MLEHPVYVRIPTENDEPYFKNRSAAEAVISAVISAQKLGWLRLHGFVVLPDALEMVMTPIRQGVSGVVANIQAETIPMLTVLLPEAGMVWSHKFAHTALTSQIALDARMNMLLLSPVANSITEKAEDYPYSSANPRYFSMVSTYAGFQKSAPEPQPAPDKLPALIMTTTESALPAPSVNGLPDQETITPKAV